MSKLISLGLLALLLSLLAAPVIAERGEACEVLKGVTSPGLYGLCIAYHNAGSPDAMQKFLDKYNEKKGPDDPVMPGTEEGVPCPCFNEEELKVLGDAGTAFQCAVSTSGTGLDLALYQGGVFQFGTDDLGCFKYDLSVPDFIDLGTSIEENEECRKIILEAIDRDFVVEDCQEGDS